MAKKKSSKKSKTSTKSKPKKTKRATKKKVARKAKAVKSQQQIIIIKGEGRVPLKRAAAEQAAGGFGAGFGIAAGHEFGEWLFD